MRLHISESDRPRAGRNVFIGRALMGLLLTVGVGLLILSCGSGGSSGSGSGNGGAPVPSCDVSVDEGDCDGDMVANDEDAFPENACASVDGDGDGVPNMVHTTAAVPACIDPDAVAVDNCADIANPNQLNSDSAHPLQERKDAFGDACDPDDDGDLVNDDDDDFPLDRGRSCFIVVTGGSPNHNSATADCDNDGSMNNADVDDDNDGLIELYDGAMLDNMRHNVDGTGYKTSSGASDDTTGMPAAKPPVCTDFSGNLCGYELGDSFSFPGGWIPLPDRDLTSAGSGSFGGVFEGNGYTLDGLSYITASTFAVGGLFDTIENTNAIVRNLRLTGSIQSSASGNSDRGLGGITGVGLRGNNLIAVSSGVELTSGAARAVGGLVGVLSDSGANTSIFNSFADGAIMGTGSSGSLGGLVGFFQSGLSTIADSYAAGAMTGSDEADERIGGLLGHSFAGSIATSYARGDVDGAAGADNVGGLVGRRGSAAAPSTNSYHSGTIAADAADTTTTDGTPQTVAQLQGCGADGSKLSGAASALVCTGLYTSWSATNWDFGTATQFPALKYAEISATNSADCSPAPSSTALADLAPRPEATAQPYCGKLLVGQTR